MGINVEEDVNAFVRKAKAAVWRDFGELNRAA
jgi:hypothetical protein